MKLLLFIAFAAWLTAHLLLACNSKQQWAETSLKRILTFPLSKALKKCEFDPPLGPCRWIFVKKCRARGIHHRLFVRGFSVLYENDDGTWVVYERRKKIVNSFAKVVTLYWWCWVDLTMQHQHSNVVTEISYGLTFSSWIIRLNPISHTGYDVADNKNWILIGIKCKYLYYFAEGMPLCAFTVQLNEF